MIKRFIIVFILLVLVCGGLIGFNIVRDQKIAEFFANMPPQTVAVSATEVETGEWRPGIEAVGTVKAVRGVDLGAETSGVVRSVNFSSNDRVSAGEVLVQLDDEVEKAQIPGAEAALKNAQSHLKRIRNLRDKAVATESDLDSAVNSVAAARSELERLRAVVAQKAIKAPFDGVAGIPRIDVGQYVQPGTVIATFQDLDRLRVDFTVPERDAGLLSMGQSVRFGAEEGELAYDGRITGIDPKVDPSTRLVSVRAELDTPEKGLLPGQFVFVRVQLDTEPDVVALPQSSVITSLYGDYVYVLVPAGPEGQSAAADKGTGEGGGLVGTAEASEQGASGQPETYKADQVFVKVGRRNQGTIEVLSGLKPGQTVVTSGQNKLQNGSLATVNNEIDPKMTGVAGSAQ